MVRARVGKRQRTGAVQKLARDPVVLVNAKRPGVRQSSAAVGRVHPGNLCLAAVLPAGCVKAPEGWCSRKAGAWSGGSGAREGSWSVAVVWRSAAGARLVTGP